jgi:hypothetical protein
MEYTSKHQQADKNINNNDSWRNKDANEAALTNTAGACGIYQKVFPHAACYTQSNTETFGRLDSLLDDWKLFYSSSTDTLYEKESSANWRIWNRNQGRQPTRMQGFRRSMQWRLDCPEHSQPTTVTAGTVKRIQGTTSIRALPPEGAQKWWYEMVEPTEHIECLAQGFREGTVI